MKPTRTKPTEKHVEEERQHRAPDALATAVSVDLLLHVVYIALLTLFSREYVLLAAHAAGLAVVLAAYAAYRRGLYGEGAAMMLLLFETGALSIAWMAIFGFPVLVYCHVLCFLIPGLISGTVSSGIFRALIVVICAFAVTIAVIGITVPPTEGGESTQIYALATIFALCITHVVHAVSNRKQLSRSIARYEHKIAGAKDESMRDPLTSLWNRRYLDYSSGNYEFMSSTTPCTVAMLDLDLFKRVNDTYSHMVGDQMLLYFSTFLKKNLRASDHIIRWGGKEFLIIFTNTDVGRAHKVLDNLREDFKASPMPLNDTFIPMTFTAGICQLVEGMMMQEAVESADALLYSGKSAGRDRIVSG